MKAAVLALYFAAFFLFALGMLLMRSPIKRFFGKQVQRYVKLTGEKRTEGASVKQGLNRLIDFVAPLFINRSFASKLQALIDKAGVPLRSSEFVFFHILGVLGSALLGFVVGGPLGMWLFVVVAGILPVAGMIRLKNQRERRFHDQLPDTLSLIAGALKAGYSFLQAVDMTVRETAPPMSLEFKRVLTEARLGLPVEQALENMAKRVESSTFDWTVMAVKTQREVGGNLAEILEILAETIRERDRVGRQIKVLTAEGRLSAIILFLLPFAVSSVLWVINPGYLGLLFSHSLGIAMLAMSALMLAVGGVWLRKVVTIEV
ncbi:MAG: type II secretion system F family protein [Candidatus Aquicultorales bacterium]